MVNYWRRACRCVPAAAHGLLEVFVPSIRGTITSYHRSARDSLLRGLHDQMRNTRNLSVPSNPSSRPVSPCRAQSFDSCPSVGWVLHFPGAGPAKSGFQNSDAPLPATRPSRQALNETRGPTATVSSFLWWYDWSSAHCLFEYVGWGRRSPFAGWLREQLINKSLCCGLLTLISGETLTLIYICEH